MAEKPPGPSFVLAAGVVWPPLCLIAVALRFYSRRKQNGGRRWSIDDWLTVPALILTWGLGAVVVSGLATKSLGYTAPKPPEGETPLTFSSPQSRTTRTDLWAFELIQIPSLTCVKLSFVYFYRRIFCGRADNRPFDYMTKAVIALLIAWMVAFWFSLLFACHGNFSKYWQSVAVVTENCPKTLTWEMGFAVSDAILDIFVYILPLHQIFKLELTLAKKLALLGIFSVGAVTIAASLTRMAIFIEVISVDFSNKTDNDLIITSGLYWSMNESGLALLVANLPSIYSLIKSYRAKAASNSSKPRYTSRNKWVRNLSNFRGNNRTGLAFSDSEMTGFRTLAEAEPVSLDDLRNHNENQVRVDSHVEITWRDAKLARSKEIGIGM